MDLGIAGKWALVGGASKGLGWGCAAALAAEGVNVVMVARGAEALQAAAQALTSFFTGIAPSNSECSVWTRRWMNRGADIGPA